MKNTMWFFKKIGKNCMNTRKIAAEFRLKHWAQLIHERAEKGVSVHTYCETIGIHENTYYYWQRKLREAASLVFGFGEYLYNRFKHT